MFQNIPYQHCFCEHPYPPFFSPSFKAARACHCKQGERFIAMLSFISLPQTWLFLLVWVWVGSGGNQSCLPALFKISSPFWARFCTHVRSRLWQWVSCLESSGDWLGCVHPHSLLNSSPGWHWQTQEVVWAADKMVPRCTRGCVASKSPLPPSFHALHWLR